MRFLLLALCLTNLAVSSKAQAKEDRGYIGYNAETSRILIQP